MNAKSEIFYVLNDNYCTWDILRENIVANGDSVPAFLTRVDECKTREELERLVGEYI